MLDGEWVRMLLPQRRRGAHKGEFGRVLVIAGSAGMTGAAALTAEAALRVGAGLVTVGCPASINDVLEVKLTEAMTFGLPETFERTLDTRGLAPILELAKEAEVLAIGEKQRHAALQRLVLEHRQELDRRWRFNVILNKWLEYLSDQGHLILDR